MASFGIHDMRESRCGACKLEREIWVSGARSEPESGANVRLDNFAKIFLRQVTSMRAYWGIVILTLGVLFKVGWCLEGEEVVSLEGNGTTSVSMSREKEEDGVEVMSSEASGGNGTSTVKTDDGGDKEKEARKVGEVRAGGVLGSYLAGIGTDSLQNNADKIRPPPPSITRRPVQQRPRPVYNRNQLVGGGGGVGGNRPSYGGGNTQNFRPNYGGNNQNFGGNGQQFGGSGQNFGGNGQNFGGGGIPNYGGNGQQFGGNGQNFGGGGGIRRRRPRPTQPPQQNYYPPQQIGGGDYYPQQSQSQYQPQQQPPQYPPLPQGGNGYRPSVGALQNLPPSLSNTGGINGGAPYIPLQQTPAPTLPPPPPAPVPTPPPKFQSEEHKLAYHYLQLLEQQEKEQKLKEQQQPPTTPTSSTPSTPRLHHQQQAIPTLASTKPPLPTIIDLATTPDYYDYDPDYPDRTKPTTTTARPTRRRRRRSTTTLPPAPVAQPPVPPALPPQIPPQAAAYPPPPPYYPPPQPPAYNPYAPPPQAPYYPPPPQQPPAYPPPVPPAQAPYTPPLTPQQFQQLQQQQSGYPPPSPQYPHQAPYYPPPQAPYPYPPPPPNYSQSLIAAKAPATPPPATTSIDEYDDVESHATTRKPLPSTTTPVPLTPAPFIPPPLTPNMHTPEYQQNLRLQQLKLLLELHRLRNANASTTFSPFPLNPNSTTESPFDFVPRLVINPKIPLSRLTSTTDNPNDPVQDLANIFGSLAVGNLAGVVDGTLKYAGSGVFNNLNNFVACQANKRCGPEDEEPPEEAPLDPLGGRPYQVPKKQVVHSFIPHPPQHPYPGRRPGTE